MLVSQAFDTQSGRIEALILIVPPPTILRQPASCSVYGQTAVSGLRIPSMSGSSLSSLPGGVGQVVHPSLWWYQRIPFSWIRVIRDVEDGRQGSVVNHLERPCSIQFAVHVDGPSHGAIGVGLADWIIWEPGR